MLSSRIGSTQQSHLSSTQDLNELHVLKVEHAKEKRRNILGRLHKQIQDEKQRCMRLTIEKSQRLIALQISSDKAGIILQRKSLARVIEKVRVSYQ